MATLDEKIRAEQERVRFLLPPHAERGRKGAKAIAAIFEALRVSSDIVENGNASQKVVVIEFLKGFK